MLAPASAQEWDGRLWKPYQPGQFGGQRRQTDGVYGGVEAIVWNVNRVDNIKSWFPSMDFSEIDSEFKIGTRVTFGNRSGHHGWRCSYYGISGLGGNLTQDVSVDWSQGGHLAEYPFNEFITTYWGDIPLVGNLVMYTDWLNVQSQVVSVKTSTRVSNLDLAWTYRAHPFSWGELELYAGAKYWDFKERLYFSDDNRSNVYRYSFWEGWALADSDYSIIFGDSNGRLVTLEFGTGGNSVLDDEPTPLSLSVLRTRSFQARNRITGPNLGASITRRNQRWTFGADASVFLGVNGQSYSFREGAEINFYDSTTNRFYSIMQTNTSGSSDGGTREANELSLSDLRGLQLLSTNIDGLDGSTYHKQRRTVFSPGVSLQLSAKWQWTDAIGVKVAFDSTIVDNVARGSNLVATANMVDVLDSNGNPVKDSNGKVQQKRDGYNYSLRSKGDVVLLYGVTFGLEFRR